MSGTTSIDSLPSDPTVSAGAPVQNVQMEIKEKHVSYDPNVKENDGNICPPVPPATSIRIFSLRSFSIS